jgi:5-methylcytosine-specific restriction endonuclease McrA
MDRPYRDADWLRRRYHDDGATQREIAEECGVSSRTIRKWMKKYDIETREVRGENHGLYGKERRESVKRKISATLEGREFDAEWRGKIAEANRGRTLSEETCERISAALSGRTKSYETRRKMSESTAGEANPNWRGGYDGRYGPVWGPARDTVVERDEICQNCGEDGNERQLQVHHIIPVRAFRDSSDVSLADAHDLSNLVLLCTQCHGKADYGLLGLESAIEDPRSVTK